MLQSASTSALCLLAIALLAPMIQANSVGQLSYYTDSDYSCGSSSQSAQTDTVAVGSAEVLNGGGSCGQCIQVNPMEGGVPSFTVQLVGQASGISGTDLGIPVNYGGVYSMSWRFIDCSSSTKLLAASTSPSPDSTPSPSTEPSPSPSTEPSPSPSSKPTPSPSTEATPSPSTEATPSPSTEASISSLTESSPSPSPESSPSPSPDSSPSPSPDSSPSPSPKSSPSPSPDSSPSPSPKSSPSPSPDSSPSPSKDPSPSPSSSTKSSPSPSPDSTPSSSSSSDMSASSTSSASSSSSSVPAATCTGDGTYYSESKGSGAFHCAGNGLSSGYPGLPTVALNGPDMTDASCGQCIVLQGSGISSSDAAAQGLGTTPFPASPTYATINNQCPECKHCDIDFYVSYPQTMNGRYTISWSYIDCAEALSLYNAQTGGSRKLLRSSTRPLDGPLSQDLVQS